MAMEQVLSRMRSRTAAFRPRRILGLMLSLAGFAVLLPRRQRSAPGLSVFLALSAGTMFAAAVLSLLAPAVDLSAVPAALDVLLAALLGFAAMAVLDRLLPRQHPMQQPLDARSVHAAKLMVLAIAVHNLPEGFAVGAGFAGDEALGWGTALSIGLQNIPEGLIVATALWSTGLSHGRALALATATGLLEPLGAAAGALAAGVSEATLPWALAAAGGAMVFVVVAVLVPAALKGPRSPAAALSFLLGFLGMALLLAG
jgi:zinc transporter, ZIP family